MVDYKVVKRIKIKGKLVGCMWYINDWCENFEDPVYEINQRKYKYAVDVDDRYGYIKFKTIDDMTLFYESLPYATGGSGFISKDGVDEEQEDI